MIKPQFRSNFSRNRIGFKGIHVDALVYRLVLAGVALSPVALAATMTVSWASVPLGVMVGGIVGLVAQYAFLRRDKPRRRGPVLLRRAALRCPATDLPTLDAQRLALSEARTAATDLRTDPKAPPTRTLAIARIQARILDSWKVTNISALPRDLTLALTLLERLLNTDPGEAGRIAQLFQRPDVVLGLRQEIDRIARTRATYDRAFAAFQATRVMQAADPAPRNLVIALQSLGTPDIDLWHRIVSEHDPADPAQREAALWCLEQSDCDSAIVATYLSRIAEGAQLESAFVAGDHAFLDRVRQIVENCNAGFYRHQGLGYVPAENASERLGSELEVLAALSGARRWPDPQCVFTEIDGRAPRPRPAWDLAHGRLIAPPDPADYL